jgi:hypothetical protein
MAVATSVYSLQISVRILVTDPLGRKIGHDPITHASVNELGDDAWYMGSITSLQVIAIFVGVEGSYSVTGVGTATGSYRIKADEFSESGDIASEQVFAGQITVGQMIGPGLRDGSRSPRVTPLVTAPSALTVLPSEARRPGIGDSDLMAFLLGGSAVDDTDRAATPCRTGGQPGRIGQYPVPAGDTLVTFRFWDSSFVSMHGVVTVVPAEPVLPTW